MEETKICLAKSIYSCPQSAQADMSRNFFLLINSVPIQCQIYLMIRSFLGKKSIGSIDPQLFDDWLVIIMHHRDG